MSMRRGRRGQDKGEASVSARQRSLRGKDLAEGKISQLSPPLFRRFLVWISGFTEHSYFARERSGTGVGCEGKST